MNKISEDEATEKLKRLVTRCKECKFATCENCEINWNEVQAIGKILDLYKQEKEDNKLYKLCMIQNQDFRDRLIDILGVGDNEETILQHIATLISEKKEIDELKQELQQEKEKNKEIEIRLQEEINEVCELKTRLFGNSISKDKIREKIESIENMSEIEVCDEGINYRLKIEDKAKIKVLKELLEEN